MFLSVCIDIFFLAISSFSAIRVLRYTTNIDLAQLDHMMPEMDGVEATRAIREEIGTEYAKNIPIIMLTANAIAGNEEMILSKGFQAFISKPIDIRRLDSVIRYWVKDKNIDDSNAERQTAG